METNVIYNEDCFVDVAFKFSKAVVDNAERKEYIDKYGLIING